MKINAWQFLVIPVYFSYWHRPFKYQVFFSWLSLFVLSMIDLLGFISSLPRGEGSASVSLFETLVFLPIIGLYSSVLGLILSEIVRPMAVMRFSEDMKNLNTARKVINMLLLYSSVILAVHISDYILSRFTLVSVLIIPMCGLLLIGVCGIATFHVLWKQRRFEDAKQSPQKAMNHITRGVLYWMLLTMTYTMTNYIIFTYITWSSSSVLSKSAISGILAVNSGWIVILIALYTNGVNGPDLVSVYEEEDRESESGSDEEHNVDHTTSTT